MRSGFERTLAAQLKKLGLSFEYEPVKLPFVIERTYCPDFKVGDIYIEAKGLLDQDTRSKMVAVKKAHPHLDIRFVFMRAENKLSKNSKQTYGTWADKHGFPWADGSIPESWFNDE